MFREWGLASVRRFKWVSQHTFFCEEIRKISLLFTVIRSYALLQILTTGLQVRCSHREDSQCSCKLNPTDWSGPSRSAFISNAYALLILSVHYLTHPVQTCRLTRTYAHGLLVREGQLLPNKICLATNRASTILESVLDRYQPDRNPVVPITVQYRFK